MVPRTFPLDIQAVKEYGVERWQREFSWPVSDQEFIALANAIESRVRETIARVGGDIGLAFLIARRLPIAVEHLLHARAVVDRIRAAGATPMCSSGAQWYAEILDGPRLRRAPTVSRTVPVRSFRVRPAMRAVRWGREVAANAAMSKVIARFRNGKHASLCGSTHPFLAEQLTRTPAWVATFYVDELAKAPDPPPALRVHIRDVAAAFADDCMHDAERCGFPSNAEAAIAMRDVTEEMLVAAVRMLQRMRVRVAQRPIVHGYLSAASNVTQRAFAIAVRERGGRVTSAAHGGFVGLFNTPVPSYSEFACSDTYVTYTDGSAELCTRIQRSRPTIVPNECRIVSGASAVYRNIREAIRGRSPHNIRTVMVIGFPQNAQRKSTTAAALGLQQLDLELRLIDTLRTAGYGVVYKAHPDRLAEVRGIFEGRAAVITEDFRTAHAYADAYVFGSMRTTAFSIALCTQKPIIAVLMDEEPAIPFPDALALLARRVAIIHAMMDEHTRIVFDPTALTDALAHPADPSDTAFFDRYLAAPPD